MKKILILLAALLLVTGFAFAQEYYEYEEEEDDEREIEFFNWEFSVAFPVHWTNDKHDPANMYPFNPDIVPDKTVTANTAIGMSMNFNFTKNFGLVLDSDFTYATKLTGFGYSSSDSNTMFGANVFLGPQFYIVNSDRLRVPLAIGAHMYYFEDETWLPFYLHDQDGASLWMNRSDLQLGAGVMFGVQFHFDNSIYMFSRTSVYIDFVRIHDYEGIIYYTNQGVAGQRPAGVYEEVADTNYINGIHWTVKPTIGIGVKF